MMRRLSQMILSIAMLVTLAVATPFALAQDDTQKGKPTVKGQMKEGTKEMGKAGKSLGHNVKHGRIVRGGKHFGKHVYHGGKHYGKGTVKATKNTGEAVKKAVKP
jgi:Ni/Co efflux regulator RcnB